jgi:hypothetical protein
LSLSCTGFSVRVQRPGTEAQSSMLTTTQ